MNPHNNWKERGAEFHEFLQPVGLKTQVLKVSRLGWVKAQRALNCSWREAHEHSVETVI